MAKTSAVEKNKKRIKLVKKYESKRKKLKKIVMDKKLNLNDRFEAALKLAKLPKNSAKSRIRNRCEITGRPHGYYRKLKMSRIALRELASMGKIPGMTKFVNKLGNQLGTKLEYFYNKYYEWTFFVK